MNRFFIYPMNIGCILLLALFFSLFNFSTFFNPPNSYEILSIAILSSLFFLQYPFFKKKINLNLDAGVNKSAYKKYLYFGLIGFFVEFLIFGAPLFSEYGREDIGSIPTLHVIFYSCIFVSILFSSLYSTKKDIFICLSIALLLSSLLLSRQMIMVSFLILLVSISVRFKIKTSTFLKILFSLIAITFLFGILGNLRQTLAGDYVDQYIIVIGGANENGEKLGDIIYWLWLYIASPMYNLFVNIAGYYSVGDRCNTNAYYGSCTGNYALTILTPDAVLNYLGIDKFEIDLAIPHLNVGTGYAAAARILGIPGIILQIILYSILYFVGYRLMDHKFKPAYIVYFSVLSAFMIFDNLFIRIEFFFVFILLYFAKYKFTWGKA